MDAITELKHSIKLHVLINNGPTPQLSVFLLKLIDFIEDLKAKLDVEAEMMALAFAIVEAIAIFVQRSIDDRYEKAKSQGVQFPEQIRVKSDELLVVVGKSRGLPDKKAAKDAVLNAIADALKALSTFTKAKYPDITDSSGNVL